MSQHLGYFQQQNGNLCAIVRCLSEPNLLCQEKVKRDAEKVKSWCHRERQLLKGVRVCDGKYSVYI